MLAILGPFLRPQPMTQSGEDWSRSALKAALAAVDKDEARGVLSESEAARQRADIAAKAKAVLEEREEIAPAPKGRSGLIIAAVSLAIAPVILFGAYLVLGTPYPKAVEKNAQAAAAQRSSEIGINEAIAQLEAELENTPEDSRLWARLGDLKIRNEDFIGAEAAFERAVALPFAAPEEGARLWLILAMTRRTQGLELSDPKIVAPLKKSLELDENSPSAILLERIEAEKLDGSEDRPTK